MPQDSSGTKRARRRTQEVTDRRPFSPDELLEIEAAHPDGLSSRQVIDLFQARGVRLSEATFRKYVQLGLLPRSTRRVGRKGKHKGSKGIYPVGVVRRLNLIKAMMAEGLTLEEIRESFVVFKNDLDALSELLDGLFRDFETRLRTRALSPARQRRMALEVEKTRQRASTLLRRLERLGSAIAATPPELGPGG